jgi:hypothetical protein
MDSAHGRLGRSHYRLLRVSTTDSDDVEGEEVGGCNGI